MGAAGKAKSRRAYFDDASRSAAFLAAETTVGTFVVPASTGLGRTLFVTRKQRERAVLKRALGSLREHTAGWTAAGCTLVDVGARIGTSAIAGLRLGGFARVVALERDRERCRLLRVNAQLNGLRQELTVLNVAVSGSSGDGDSVTLDSLCARGVLDCGRVGLLWMHTTKPEDGVLTGASALLAAKVPMIVDLDPVQMRAGHGWKRLLRVVRGNYTHFVGLRDRRRDSGRPATVDELPAFGRQLARGPRTPRLTSVLLFTQA
jgi:hypothetical protein